MTFDPSTYGTEPAPSEKFDPSTYGQALGVPAPVLAPPAALPKTPEQRAVQPPSDDRGFLTRAWDSVVGGAHAVAHVGKELGTAGAQGFVESGGNPVAGLGSALGVLEDPRKRRELERGVGDVVTLGYGNRLAARVGNAAGDVSRGTSLNEQLHFEPNAESAGHRAAGQGVGVPSQVESEDAEAAPEYRAAGQAGAMFIPNPAGAVAGAVGRKIVSPLAGAFEKAIGGKIVGAASKIPVAGPAAATLAAGAGGAAKGIAGYELTAPLVSAAGAGAEGHRIEAAEQAATDPAGLLLSGAAGAVPAMAKQAAGETAKYVEKAKKTANDWIASDLVGETKGASTATARKQMARAADHFPELIGRDPEVRNAIADARHGDLPKVQTAVDVVSKRLDTVQEPKASLYNEVDTALPDGGIKSGDVVNAYEAEIKARRATGHEYDAQIAEDLERRAGLIKRAANWGAEDRIKPGSLSPQAELDLKQLETVRENLAARPGFDTSAIDDQIAAIKGTGKIEPGFNPDHVVSTRELRKLASDAQRTAFSREGGLNGTERYERALDVAEVPVRLLDRVLDHAKEKAGDAVKQIETMDKDTSTLLAAKKVLVQRLDHAKANSVGAGMPANVTHGLRSAAMKAGTVPAASYLAGTGHYLPAAGVVAAAALPAIKRVVDTNIAKFASTPAGQKVVARLVHAAATGGDTPGAIQNAIAAGVPPRVAQKIADISRQTFALQPPDDTTAEASP